MSRVLNLSLNSTTSTLRGGVEAVVYQRHRLLCKSRKQTSSGRTGGGDDGGVERRLAVASQKFAKRPLLLDAAACVQRRVRFTHARTAASCRTRWSDDIRHDPTRMCVFGQWRGFSDEHQDAGSKYQQNNFLQTKMSTDFQKNIASFSKLQR